jgi:hypothetical protein
MFSCKCFQVLNKRYVSKEHSRIMKATIYIYIHHSTHMHILIWLYDLTLFDPRFDFTIYILLVCSFMHLVQEEGITSFIVLVRIHKYNIYERFESVMQNESLSFILKTYKKLRNNWAKELETWSLTWLFYLSIAQDPSESSKAPWLKVIWVSLKVRPVNFNLKENSLLNARVLLRSCITIFKILKCPVHH